MANIDKGITWITVEEARRCWEFKTRSFFTHKREKGEIKMRKSAGTWLLSVRDMIYWYGQPKHPIRWR